MNNDRYKHRIPTHVIAPKPKRRVHLTVKLVLWAVVAGVVAYVAMKLGQQLLSVFLMVCALVLCAVTVWVGVGTTDREIDDGWEYVETDYHPDFPEDGFRVVKRERW